jgi:pimeloyl-ACP methyl ester carboxylesterase
MGLRQPSGSISRVRIAGPTSVAERTDNRVFEEVVEMATFVLVHGAFGSPAELAPVIPEVEAIGHRGIAVDLPCQDPAATLDDYARTVVGAIAGIDGPVVVVGLSAGGATISLVPDQARVERLVYVTAFVPESGRSVVELCR